ncbi:MAG: acyl-CoA thioesterase [Gammaproteobacteria bacterium]|nr:acyl-CoA thioesterase [Gammaproteobacteria bacterium]
MYGVVRQTVAYADTDAGGVMYHGRYIELAERSRLQWMIGEGYSFDNIAHDHDTLLVVHKMTATFRTPARLEDNLTAHTILESVSAARSTWRTDIVRGQDLVAKVNADVVAISARRKQISRIPDELLRSLLQKSQRNKAQDRSEPFFKVHSK